MVRFNVLQGSVLSSVYGICDYPNMHFGHKDLIEMDVLFGRHRCNHEHVRFYSIHPLPVRLAQTNYNTATGTSERSKNMLRSEFEILTGIYVTDGPVQLH